MYNDDLHSRHFPVFYMHDNGLTEKVGVGYQSQTESCAWKYRKGLGDIYQPVKYRSS